MSIFDRFKRNSNVNKYIDDDLSNSRPFAQVLRNYAKAPEFRPREQVRGITYKAIDKIGLSLSNYEPEVKRGGTEDKVKNSPFYDFYRKPNPRTTGRDFVHMYGMLMEIYGEAFIYEVRGERSNLVKEIYHLNPAQIELAMSDGEVVGYILHKNNGDRVPFLADEIIHDKRPNPFNEYRGMSVLEQASLYVDTEVYTSSFTLNYIKNAASPSGIVSLPNMDKPTFQQFVAQWREGYEGPQNAGKTAFIRGGEANFSAVGSTLKDIDQQVTRNMAKEDVLMMFEVPKPLLGMSDGSGFGRNNIEALSYVFQKEKIDPMMKRLDDIFTIIAREIGRDTNVVVDHESQIPDNDELELSYYDKAVGRWMTPNDIRAEEGLLPLPDGDTLSLINKDAPATKSLQKRTVRLAKSIVVNKSEAQEKFRQDLVDTNEVYVKELKRTMDKYLTAQQSSITDKISASKKAFEQWLFEIKEQSEIMAAAVVPVIVSLMEKQVEGVANFISGELLVISPEIRKDVEQNILKVAGLFNTDTIAALEATLTEGQTAGESLVKMKKRVEQVYQDAKGYRAERIARTESLKASNSTAELVYKQNGYSQVEWFTNPGACEFCRTFSGRTKSIGSSYVGIGDVITGDDGSQMRIEYSDIMTPPLHPNCTCSLVPVA